MWYNIPSMAAGKTAAREQERKEMDKKLAEISLGREENRILPFFWLHGDDQEKFKEELDRIEEAGIHAICLESRPHPDFAGEGWWRDLDMIMEEARRRDMKVWDAFWQSCHWQCQWDNVCRPAPTPSCPACAPPP